MQARMEEVSSDDELNPGNASDPDEMDITDFSASPLVPRTTFGHSNSGNSSSSVFQPSSSSSFPQGRSVPASRPSPATTAGGPPRKTYDKERVKKWQCLYPIYFDAGRTRAQGRRVGKSLAVENPLAREIVEAVGRMGLQVVFEPGACHPKDWANPGRVRVLLKEEGKVKESTTGVDEKHKLYIKVAEYLQQNPTTNLSPLRLPVPGLPKPSGPMPPPAVPTGWKINSILPLHSAAVTGGGVSDNLFKDMMNQMQGGVPGQEAITAPGPAPKAKKDKKKSKA